MSMLSDIKNQPDEVLLKHYRETGNKELVGVLFHRYAHLVLGLCMKYLESEAQAQDASMQIFEKLIDDLLKHDIQYFKSWLYMVSKNHCLMLLRKEVPPTVELADTEKNSATFMESSPEVHLINKEHKQLQMDRMNYCLEQLKQDQRTCVELFYMQELCYQDICKQTSFSLKQVKSYLQNGKRNLKNCMSQDA